MGENAVSKESVIFTHIGEGIKKCQVGPSYSNILNKNSKFNRPLFHKPVSHCHTHKGVNSSKYNWKQK